MSLPKNSFQPLTKSSPQPETPKVPPRKAKFSPRLNRWAQARSIRSRKRLDRAGENSAQVVGPVAELVREESSDDETSEEIFMDGIEFRSAKSIYVISDGTGWTAEHTVNAALGQFEHCLIDRACAVNTHLFSSIDDGEKLLEVIKQAAKEGALVAYTLADPSMAEAAKKACQLWGIPSTDLLSPMTEALSSHLGFSPSGLRRGEFPLSEEYFKRIEAIEFTIKQDDGALPQNLHKADIVLAGVSRTGKTPLSIYLSQKGYKVANVPMVVEVELPKALFEVDNEKVFGLTISPLALQTIRRSRAKAMLLSGGRKTNYAEMEHVRRELEFARKVFLQNPNWVVIDITGKAIEETAALVLRHYYDRKQKHSMPRISKRY